MVRFPGRLGNPESITALQDDPDGRSEINPMPRRDENWIDVVSGPDSRADPPAAIQQLRNASLFHPGFPVCSRQKRLRASDGGLVQNQSQMRRDPETARVGDPLSVDDDQVGLQIDFSKCFQKERRFPERQEAGDVRDPDFHAGLLLLQNLQFRERENQDPRNPFMVLLVNRDIRAGDPSDFGKAVFKDDPIRQLFLKRDHGRD